MQGSELKAPGPPKSGLWKNAAECPAWCLPVGKGGDECSDFKKPMGRPAKAGLSGNRIFSSGNPDQKHWIPPYQVRGRLIKPGMTHKGKRFQNQYSSEEK
jgi:hypothetical protein